MRKKLITILLITLNLFGFRALADETNLIGEWEYKAIGCIAPDKSPSSINESDYIYYQFYNQGTVFNTDGTSVEKSLSLFMSPYICLSADLTIEYTVDGNLIHRKLVDLQVKMSSCYNPEKTGDLTETDIEKLESLIESEKKKKLVDLSFEISEGTLYLMYNAAGKNICNKEDHHHIVIYERASSD